MDIKQRKSVKNISNWAKLPRSIVSLIACRIVAMLNAGLNLHGTKKTQSTQSVSFNLTLVGTQGRGNSRKKQWRYKLIVIQKTGPGGRESAVVDTSTQNSCYRFPPAWFPVTPGRSKWFSIAAVLLDWAHGPPEPNHLYYPSDAFILMMFSFSSSSPSLCYLRRRRCHNRLVLSLVVVTHKRAHTPAGQTSTYQSIQFVLDSIQFPASVHFFQELLHGEAVSELSLHIKNHTRIKLVGWFISKSDGWLVILESGCKNFADDSRFSFFTFSTLRAPVSNWFTLLRNTSNCKLRGHRGIINKNSLSVGIFADFRELWVIVLREIKITSATSDRNRTTRSKWMYNRSTISKCKYCILTHELLFTHNICVHAPKMRWRQSVVQKNR